LHKLAAISGSCLKLIP